MITKCVKKSVEFLPHTEQFKGGCRYGVQTGTCSLRNPGAAPTLGVEVRLDYGGFVYVPLMDVKDWKAVK